MKKGLVPILIFELEKWDLEMEMGYRYAGMNILCYNLSPEMMRWWKVAVF